MTRADEIRERAATERPEAWLDVEPVSRYGDPGRSIPQCSEPSPTGAMLCILPDSGDLPHHFEQHLGIDRGSNFRGWPDKRTWPNSRAEESP